MRSTIHLGLICLTIAFICFLKYFAGPLAIVKEQQDFVLNMAVFGPPALAKRPPRNDKIKYVPPPTPPGMLRVERTASPLVESVGSRPSAFFLSTLN